VKSSAMPSAREEVTPEDAVSQQAGRWPFPVRSHVACRREGWGSNNAGGRCCRDERVAALLRKALLRVPAVRPHASTVAGESQVPKMRRPLGAAGSASVVLRRRGRRPRLRRGRHRRHALDLRAAGIYSAGSRSRWPPPVCDDG
jgi:hypothetical protein